MGTLLWAIIEIDCTHRQNQFNMKSFIAMFIICSSLTSAEFRSEGFKLNPVKSFDKVDTTHNCKTLIECCSFCLATSPCQGVQYDGDSCTSISNVLTTQIGSSQAWIMVPYVSNKAKILLVGGASKDMELLNLDTKQSFVLDFPLSWPQGGQISEDTFLFCDYETDQKCVLLNTHSLEIEDLEVTVDLQERSKGLTVEYGGSQVLWLTGGRINDNNVDSSQVTSLMENIPGPAWTRLPLALDGHCMVRVNATTVAILAGYVQSTSKKPSYMYFKVLLL